MIQAEQPQFARSAIRGTAWRYLTFFSGKLMVLISMLVLARLLSKDDFGVVGYAVTTIGFLDAMSDLGIAPAVIFFRDDEHAPNTAFWLGLIISLILFALTWLCGPLIAAYFKDPRAGPVTQVLAITFPISALGNIHEALLRKKLAFGKTFIPDFVQALVKGGISILCAFLGFGPWSLIIGQISGAALAVIAFWLVTAWRPTLEFSRQTAISLLNYGKSIVGVDLLGILLLNLDYLLVGRYLGPIALGIYILGFRIPDLLIMQFSRILSTVIFPIYTKMRDVPGRLSKGFLSTCRYVSLVTIPVGLGLALVARPFVQVALTDKWMEAIPIIQTISLYSMLLSLSYNAGSAYKAEGRPQVLTRLGLVRIALLLPALYWAVTVAKSIVVVGWMQVLVAFIGGTINLVAAARLLKLPFIKILDSLAPAMVAGSMLALVTFSTLRLTASMEPLSQLVLASLAGGCVYILGLWFFFRKISLDLLASFRSALQRG